MEMDKETKELLNQAIQMGVFQKHGSILTQIMNALGDEYEIDKQALKEVVETYRKMLELQAWAPIVFLILFSILFITAISRGVSVIPPSLFLLFFIAGIIGGIYIGYLNFKLNTNLSRVLKPKSGRSE